MRVAGVDGTKGGWVAIELVDGTFACDYLIRPIEASLEELAGSAIIAIDIPISFGPRTADAAARSFLKGSASTVFSTPPRSVLEQPFGAGLGVSAQSHALGPRILHIARQAGIDARIHEVHPEASFRAMNGGQALGYSKKSYGGALKRMELLARHGIHLEIDAASAAPVDDVLDAAAAAWSAHRIATGTAKSLPESAARAGATETAIWY